MQGQSAFSPTVLIVLLLIALAAAAAGVWLVGRRRRNIAVEPVAVAGKPLAAAASSTVADDLAALADLRDKGALSDEEFKVQKDRLLSSGA